MLAKLVQKELRDKKWSLLAYSFISISFMIMYIALFPSIKSEAANYEQLFESMPKALSETFDIQAASFTQLESFLAIELFSITWPLLMALLALSRAGSSITGEIEKGSMGTLLSLPISRSRILLSKIIAGGVSIGAFAAVTVLAAIPLSAVFSINIHASRFFVLTGLGILYGLTVFAITSLIATLSSERSHVYFAIGGLLAVMYTLNIISNLRDSLNWLQYASIFHYFNATAALAQSAINTVSLAVFIASTCILLGLAFLRFRKRDIVV